MVNYTEKDIVWIGPEINVNNLLYGYKSGVFPWFSEPFVTWWCPEKRFVLKPSHLHISRSLKKLLRKNIFKIRYDTRFKEVIELCGKTRDETWITLDFIREYTRLHNLGYAHSVETYYENRLVGGLYGVSLGRMFFGESMFHIMPNASKVAFVYLALNLERLNFSLIDCQVYSDIFKSFGAFFIEREEFLRMVKENNRLETIRGKWGPPLFKDFFRF